MMTAIIVEDDPIFRDMLLDMLPKVNPNVQLLETCATLRQAKIAIEKHHPQLLLLDVELPDGKSMELLEHYDETGKGNFEVIFVTSYDKYAIDAIKKNAADYIVKPIKKEELKEALQKVENRFKMYESLQQSEELKKYVDQIRQKNEQENKIMISTNEGAVFVKVGDIIKLESSSNYTILYLEQQKKMMASKTLSVFEEILEPMNFLRIHRSMMINLNKLKSIEHNNGNYFAKMSDTTLLEISRRKKKEFFEKIAYSV
jgi:two-component system LytT family response regulator